MSRFLTILLIAAAGLAHGAEPTDHVAQRVEITVRATATVAPGIVRLGDVAEVRNGDAGRIAAWKAIELFPAPAEDVPRSVPRRAIQDMIALRLGATPAADFEGAATVRITTQPAAPAADAAPAAPRTKPTAVPRPRPLPETRAGAKQPQQPLTGDLPAGLPIVVTRRVVSSGHVLVADDLDLQIVEGLQNAAEVAVRIEDVVGKETSRPIGIGQVVNPGSLREPIVVRKNEIIRVVARTAGVRVQTSGKCLADASTGQLVEIQMLDSREKVVARVVGSRLVEVYGRGPSVAAREVP